MEESNVVAGGYYKTRDGQTVGPLEANPADRTTYVWRAAHPAKNSLPGNTVTYTRAGCFMVSQAHSLLDLVERLDAAPEFLTGRHRCIFDYTLEEYREGVARNFDRDRLR